MYERVLITFAVIGCFGAIVLLTKHRQMVVASRASQHLKKSSGKPSLVYFWSHGCPVCTMTQKKIIESIVAEYGKDRLTLAAYNTDEKPDVAREWGVRTLPTTFLLDAGGIIRHVNNGLAVAETLRKQLE